MNTSTVKCPEWLADLIEDSGGSVSFSKFMKWALNDPINGAYASGKLHIGVEGDFVTSPSLGPEFCDLLCVQIADWIKDLSKNISSNSVISIVDIGPGEGDLAFYLISSLKNRFPHLLSNIEFILVEINEGMKKRQKSRLSCFSNISIRWTTFENLSNDPVNGILIANEILDALPVDRIIFSDKKLFLQGVKLVKNGLNNYIKFTKLPLSNSILQEINSFEEQFKFKIPPKDTTDNWTTEWHTGLEDWFYKASLCINNGSLLVIDYAMEASRYYNPNRVDGTLASYRDQKAFVDVLDNVGKCDITSHLCLESLYLSASKSSWSFVGECRQGLALLSLGLSEQISNLRKVRSDQISSALRTRENLLRLVDPLGLGEFRWILFYKGDCKTNPIFLSENNHSS